MRGDIEEDKRPLKGTCVYCGAEIHGEDDAHWGDDYWDFGDGMVCENCLEAFIKDHKGD